MSRAPPQQRPDVQVQQTANFGQARPQTTHNLNRYTPTFRSSAFAQAEYVPPLVNNESACNQALREDGTSIEDYGRRPVTAKEPERVAIPAELQRPWNPSTSTLAETNNGKFEGRKSLYRRSTHDKDNLRASQALQAEAAKRAQEQRDALLRQRQALNTDLQSQMNTNHSLK